MDFSAKPIALACADTLLHFGAENSVLADFVLRWNSSSGDCLCFSSPLVLSGPHGCGKSAVVMALTKSWDQVQSECALTCNAHDLARAYSDAAKADDMRRFSRNYRTVSLLAVDDLQALAKKDREHVQVWLCGVIDDRTLRNLPTIVTCDAPMTSMPKLLERLKSRLATGLQISVELPHAETRRVLVRRSAEQLCVELDDVQVEAIVQATVGCSPRHIHAVVAASRMNPLEQQQQPSEASLDLIPTLLRTTARRFGVKVEDIRGPSRRKNTAMARSVAMFLIRELTPLSLVEVGKYFRRRDHTTVRHACAKVQAQLANQDMQEIIQSICTATGVRSRTSWFSLTDRCA